MTYFASNVQTSGRPIQHNIQSMTNFMKIIHWRPSLAVVRVTWTATAKMFICLPVWLGHRFTLTSDACIQWSLDNAHTDTHTHARTGLWKKTNLKDQEK